MTMAKSLMTIKCTLSATCFDDHGSLLVQYKVHCLMQHVQGYSRSHWKPPLGKYLLRIAPAAARATANKTMTKKCTNKTGHVDGRGGAPVQYRVHCPIEEFRALLEATKHRSSGKYCGR
jgi:hypothetical protein